MATSCQAYKAPLPGPGAVPPAVRNRQAAVEYLRGAGQTTNHKERAFLRRRAAELILQRAGRPGVPKQ